MEYKAEKGFKYISRSSVLEPEYRLVTADGYEYDVLLEIRKDRDCGFYFLSMFYRPNSAQRIHSSHISLDTRIELAELVRACFEHYMDNFGAEVAALYDHDLAG